MDGDDIEGMTWHTPGVTPLTEAEVTAEIARMEKSEADKAAADAAARKSAIAHAKSLGFTDEMIAVMYPNLGAQS
jgi:hypothetical protein